MFFLITQLQPMWVAQQVPNILMRLLTPFSIQTLSNAY
jgi:hypothetical protein